MGHHYECQYGHSDKVSVSNDIIITVCTVPVRHEGTRYLTYGGIVYKIHYRVKRRINNEVSGDDEIITVYVIRE
jgi:hypothetical protein